MRHYGGVGAPRISQCPLEALELIGVGGRFYAAASAASQAASNVPRALRASSKRGGHGAGRPALPVLDVPDVAAVDVRGPGQLGEGQPGGGPQPAQVRPRIPPAPGPSCCPCRRWPLVGACTGATLPGFHLFRPREAVGAVIADLVVLLAVPVYLTALGAWCGSPSAARAA